MGRALRFQCGLPLKLWGDYILTTVDISNILPTQVYLTIYLPMKLFIISSLIMLV